MADDPSKLSEKQLQDIQAWIKEKWKRSAECAICGTNSWQVANHFTTPVILSNNAINLGGVTYPQFMCICRNCGNTISFNAVVAKLPGEKTKEDGKAPAPGTAEGGAT